MILATIPSAFVGGIVALLIAGETWNVSPLVGLIGLFGIAVQNSLVLVTQTRALIAEGRSFREALREASIGRVRPKLMTALTAILGLLPLLLFDLHGTEIERPVAVVMIGGLITSTLFTLLALPTFYLFVHDLGARWRGRTAIASESTTIDTMKTPCRLRRCVTLVAVALVLLAPPIAAAQNRPSIILATTTSTHDSGLLDALIPRFERERGIDVKVIAVGTGAALRMAGTGDADVILVHAPTAERPYIDAGDLVDGRLVMHNDFVLVGPPTDPAGVRKQPTIADAMRSMAARGTFISRGDQSGTHIQELALWAGAGIDPRTLGRREETGQGMGATLNVADQRNAYTLTDRGTYLSQRARLTLAIVFQGDAGLRNIYHVYAVNPVNHPKAKLAEARQFIEFLTSAPVQQAIGAFKRDQLGESLFFPDAQPTRR